MAESGSGSRYEWINGGGVDSPYIQGQSRFTSGSTINDHIRCDYVQETTTESGDGNSATIETRTAQDVILKSITVNRGDVPFDGNVYDLKVDKVGLNYTIKGILKDPFEIVTGLSLTKNGDPLSKVTNITAREYRLQNDYYDMSDYRSDNSKQITFTFNFKAGSSSHTYIIYVQDNWDDDNKFVRDFNYHIKG